MIRSLIANGIWVIASLVALLFITITRREK